MAGMGWSQFAVRYGELDIGQFLASKPRPLLDGMLAKGVNSPLASSCGRLFDAVAAAVGICRERALYEGQAAVEFEALVDERALEEEDDARAYPFTISDLTTSGLPCVESLAMWTALLDDLALGTPVPRIAARFHKGLAMVIVRMVVELSQASRPQNGGKPVNTVALSGGVFHNRILLEQVTTRLAGQGFSVLTHRQVPANDGGLSLGQAVVAAARSLAR